MAQDNSQRKIENLKEEKEFLAREEVRTMEKDVARLRETEARQERERVSKIKTEEEIIREKERKEQAKLSALERTSAESEAKEREERVKRMREERELKESVMAEEGAGKETARTERFQDALKETQTREEEERKRFLARVEARIENKEGPPLPPPPVPQEIPKTPFRKPSFSQKLWVRIVLSLLVIAVLGLIVTFWYWFLVVREKPEELPVAAEVEEVKEELVIPPALFFVENSQTIKITQVSEIPFLLFQALQEKIDQGLVNRILIEDTENNEILGLKSFLEVFSTSSPEGFYDKVENDFTLFIYSQEEGNRLGLAVKIKDTEGLAETLMSWENTMEKDLEKLFELLGKDKPALVSYFRNATHEETDFRFQTFSRNDLGIVYAIYNDFFILTTSWKGMEKVLDRLKESPPI